MGGPGAGVADSSFFFFFPEETSVITWYSCQRTGTKSNYHFKELSILLLLTLLQDDFAFLASPAPLLTVLFKPFHFTTTIPLLLG